MSGMTVLSGFMDEKELLCHDYTDVGDRTKQDARVEG